jgi:hypothetical protein
MIAVAGLVLSVLVAIGSLVAWLIGDARSRGRDDALLAEVTDLKKEKGAMAAVATLAAVQQTQAQTLASLQVELAKSQQDRASIHAEIARVDNQKASREAVDGFRAAIVDMKAEMDRRFDRLDDKLEARVKDDT